MDSVGDELRHVPDATLWRMRSGAHEQLVCYARERLARQLAASGATPAEVERVAHIFDPNALPWDLLSVLPLTNVRIFFYMILNGSHVS